MMYVQIPIFSGYANIAICPGNGTVCYMIDDVQKNQNLYSEMNPKSQTFLPFYENHHYVLYPTAEDKIDDGVLYFHSEDIMKEYILEHLGTQYVTGRSLSVTVSTVAAPDFKATNAGGSGHCQENMYSTVCKKNTENEKKILKNENTKKIQNSKINQKNSLFTIISVEEHCKKITNIKNQQKNPKNKITKKIKNKKINKNICESSTLQKKDFTTKKIQKPENLLEHNFFYLLSENQGKQKTIQNEKHNRKNSNIICNI